jgi:hypothetical protein
MLLASDQPEGALEVDYGSKVIDACDFHILDLLTHSWLPVEYSLPLLRGGVNGSLLRDEEGEGGWMWILSGGMHSNEGEDMPIFKNDVVCIQVQ